MEFYFISALCSTDSQFPMHLWFCLLPQATLTLNMLRYSRLNPQISAYTVLEGVFDFNRTPLAPPRTKVVLHDKPSQQLSWDPHGTEGWYLGPALEHYICYRVVFNKKKDERFTDTLKFFPQKVPIMVTR